MSRVQAFWNDDSGAITIDWTALTAGILLLGIAVVYAILNNGVEPLVNSINGSLRTAGAGVVVGSPPDMRMANGNYKNVQFDFREGMAIQDASDGSIAIRNDDGSITEYDSGSLAHTDEGTYVIFEDGSFTGPYERTATYSSDNGAYGVYENGTLVDGQEVS